ncbi:transcriptional regulator, TetR family [Actinobacteria bacterium IMCC26207]|nr:transcriptional regulator, TetR family [Actinobacteria bacterium IMCC26207]
MFTPVSDQQREPSQLRGVVPAKQQRSRETVERILLATEQLMIGQRFNDLTVQDICLAADVSASSFYARFAAREDVLIALFDMHAEQAREEAAQGIADVMARGGDREEIVAQLIRHFLRFVRSNGAIMVSIYNDPVLTDRYWSFGAGIADELQGLIIELFGIDDPTFRVRVEFAVRVTASTVQRAVGLPTRFGERMGLEDDELAVELARMISGYLDDAVLRSSAKQGE